MANPTNGWDAVLALNTTAINDILFYDYAREKPARKASLVRVLIDGDQPDEYYALDLTLGPPLIDLTKKTVEMLVLTGQLAFIGPEGLNWMTPIESDSSLSGEIHFGDITGKNVVGQVTLDLAKGKFIPKITGVEPNSTLAVQLSNAIQAYYSGASIQLKIGSVVVGNVPAALQPTEFKLLVQQEPNGTESCLLFLIKTNGPGGSESPLKDYPLTTDVNAALIISERALMGVMQRTRVGQFTLQFTLHQSGDTWSLTGDNGSIPIGAYNQGPKSDPLRGVRTNAFTIPVNGFELRPGDGGSLEASWSTKWTQDYEFNLGQRMGNRWIPRQANVTLTFKLHAVPNIDPATCVVQFKGTPETGMSSDSSDFSLNRDSGLGRVIDYFLSLNFNSVQVPDVETFALQNIIFPGEQRVHMTNVSLAESLSLRGEVKVPLVITPREVTLVPGQTQKFTIAGSPSVDWQLYSGSGSITADGADGVYTPPSTVRRNEVTVIEAVNRNDRTSVGYAVVVVAEKPSANGLTFAPGRVIMGTSSRIVLEVLDVSGKPVEADVTLDSGAPGRLTKGRKPGQWSYTSPPDLDTARTVHLHARQGTATGIATVELKTNSDQVAITASSSSLKAGQSATLNVNGLDQVFFAADVGTVSINDDVVSYTAPSVDADTDALVFAYGTTDDGSIGSASVQIKVTKA